MAILSAADYPAIRLELSQALNERTLPDHVIEADTKLYEAEEEITQRVGDYEDLDSRQQAHARKAAIYLTASKIAPSITSIAMFGANGDYDYQTFNGKYHEERLALKAEGEIAEIADEEAEELTVNQTSASARTVVGW